MAARGCLRLANLLNKSTKTDLNGVSVQLYNVALNANYHSLCRPRDQQGEIVSHEGDVNTDARSISTSHQPYGLHKSFTCCNGILSISNFSPGIGVVARSLNGAAQACNGSMEDNPGAFENFNISPKIVERMKCCGITSLFPVQYETYERTMEGKDIIVQARTGTGKTLSFALPIVEKLEASKRNTYGKGRPLVLILVPTRELASQVQEEFKKLLIASKITTLYGGTSILMQERSLNTGVDIVVGTPGRTLDMMKRGALNLSEVKTIVLDEVDRMLDMGFAHDVEMIIKDCYTGTTRPQTMMYSATLPSWVKNTAKQYLNNNFEMVSLIQDDSVRASETVKQLALCCSASEHKGILKDLIRQYSGEMGRTIVFCTTKREADNLGEVRFHNRSAVLHGDVSQQRREFIIKGFKDGQIKTLITTDVAARGLDIPNVQLVIQMSPPNDKENFIHRTGRTGRAGKQGIAICLFQQDERMMLSQCEKLANIKLELIPPPQPLSNKRKVIDLEKKFGSVPKKTLEEFREYAQKIIAQDKAEDSLAAAIAILSGYSESSSRSLISCRKGYTTYIFTPTNQIQNVSYVSAMLSRILGEEVISDAQFTKDRKAVVFEVPAEYENVLDSYISKDGEKIEKATKLPILDEKGYQISQKDFQHRNSYKQNSQSNFRSGERHVNRFRDTFNRGFGDSYKNNDRYQKYNRSRSTKWDDTDESEFDDFKFSNQNRRYRKDFF